MRVPEGVELRAPQALSPGEQAQREVAARTEPDLLGPSHRTQHRGVQPVRQIGGPRKLGLHVRHELRVGQQPRHLVFVLVRGELVEPPCDGLAEFGAIAHRTFGGPNRLQHRHVPSCDALALEVDELRGPTGHQVPHPSGQRRAVEEVRGQRRRLLRTGMGGDGVVEAGGVGDGGAAPAERCDVDIDGDAVERNRFFDGDGRKPQRPSLIRRANQQEVRCGGATEQSLGGRECVERVNAVRHLTDAVEEVGRLRIGDRLVVHHVPGRRLAGRHHRHCSRRVAVAEVLDVGRGQQVEGHEAIGARGAEPVGRVEPARREPQVRHHGSGLLTQTGLVEALDVVAGAQRCGREHLVDGDDASAADTGEEHVVRRGERWQLEFGQCLRHGSFRGAHGLLVAARLHLDSDEGGAVPVQTAVVGIAGRLVDPRLAAELGVHRLYREAVGLHAAVAAAFAHRLVDEHPGGAGGERAALALPACVGGAVLVVDQHRHALDLAQHPLGLVEAVAMPHDRALGQCALAVPARFVGAHDDALDAFGRQLVRQLCDGQRALGVLRARHRDDLVVQQLVGDVHPGCDARLDGELPGVEERSVADVLEQVGHVDERRLTDPLGTLAAHLREPGDGAVGATGHGDQGVTADAASGE